MEQSTSGATEFLSQKMQNTEPNNQSPGMWYVAEKTDFVHSFLHTDEYLNTLVMFLETLIRSVEGHMNLQF